MNNKKTTALFVVGAVKEVHEIEFFGKKQPLDLTWTDGMIGVLPVFDSEPAAKEYANGKFKVFRLEIIKGD